MWQVFTRILPTGLVGLPSAGGYAPVWQVAHCPVTTTWVWLNSEGFQVAVGLWQEMQLVEPTGMWVTGLPRGGAPL